jgi:hypothetical protein
MNNLKSRLKNYVDQLTVGLILITLMVIINLIITKS